ncbi:hypothetical protein M413DRAFT_60743 [Hebeloma cylindrosporum]|uniref:Uncharacterized protein n=1 Tax=Hebeloma cylindrosporum TaxID=76867 RepID=A0A0C3D0Y9_HEBCY|nr:hypothetical protein M413DRAFT_60743 [Hebeloma cylindrosporum h7]
MTGSWEPKRSQKRRLSNADSPLRLSKGLLENSGYDWSRLKPGRLHVLIRNPAFLPQARSSNRVSKKDLPIREEAVKYLPRSKEFSGKDHAYHLIMSVCGMPGPYIMELAEENLTIDGHDDDVFSELGLRETKFKIDWPGLSLPPEGFKILRMDGQRYRRGDFATVVGTRVAKFIIDTQRFGKPPPTPQVIDGDTKDWDINKVDVTKIRLVSLNYFVSAKAWVPVLAMDGTK